MGSKLYQVQEVAGIARITVRTLHHYDAIGLLTPSGRTRAGYRLYSDTDLLRLQQILIHRELGFSLKEIKRLIDAPDFDYRGALWRQKELLRQRAADVAAMVRSVDAALAALDEKEIDMKEIFEGFDPKKHEQEAEKRWGDTDAYRESNARTESYSEADWREIKAQQDQLMKKMAAELNRGAPSDSEAAMKVAEDHRRYIDRWFYPCDHQMHAGLAEMYVSDERFATTFEAHAEGLARFFAAAVRANAARGDSSSES